MSIQQKKGNVEDKLNDKEVEEFLRQNPEFFVNHPELVAELKVPHPNTGAAVSLIEHQVELLRRQNSKLQKRLDDLLQIARENDRLSRNMHQLTVDLMGSRNLIDVFTRLDESLRKDFLVDAVCIRILAQPKSSKMVDRKEFAPNAAELTRHFGRQIKEGKAICGKAKTEQKKILFEDQGDKIASLAFIPLSFDKSAGLLAIGSFDEKRFHSGIGTLFLNQLGQIISKTVSRFLKPES
ncbi:MAG: DUF484 family protein [Gammaproteobacteria bacterium]|nr:DUF484 family protein [Gammaproteobacteria bacterium]